MEDLIWLLVIGYLFFGDALRKAWRRYQENRPARPPQAPSRQVPRQEQPPFEESAPWDLPPWPEEAAAVEPVSEEAPPPRRRARAGAASGIAPPAPTLATPDLTALRRLGVSDRRDLRRAIVLMTVLGPCRANEPSGAKRDL